MSFRLKWTPALVAGLLIALFFGLAFFMRVYFPYDKVFGDGWIKFTSNDAYYQLRIIDNMAQNFPHITAFDPYLILPGGGTYGGVHFLNWLVAFLAWVAGGGSPTQHTVDMVGMYLPAVLAALTVIPVYFIGKALINRWAGVIAAGMVSIFPGEYMGRTILGGLDKPAAEVFFTTLAIMFIIYAIKTSWQNQLSWSHVLKRDWKALLKPLIFSLLGGLFLGIYLITWEGALLFVVIIVIYLIIQFIIDRFKGQSGFYLGFSGFFIFLVAFIVFQPVAGGDFHTIALITAMLLPPALAFIAYLVARFKLKAYFYPVILAVLAVVFLLVFHAVKPAMLDTMYTQFTYLVPVGATGSTTIEAQRFLAPSGEFTTDLGWGNFTTSFFLIPWIPIPGLAFIALFFVVWFFTKQQANGHANLLLRIGNLVILALAIGSIFAWSVTQFDSWRVLAVLATLSYFITLIMLATKQANNDKVFMFLFIWTAVVLLVTLLQRRYAYYLVINMAVLSAYLGWQCIYWFSRRRNKTQVPETLAEQYRRSRLVGIIGGIIVFSASFMMVDTKYFFIPVFLLGLLSIFYGFWSWVKLKNKNWYMILWAFVFPIGILALAFSKDETVRVSAKKAKEQPKEALNPWLYRFTTGTLIIIVFIAVFWPNYGKAVATASPATYASSNAWEQALHWLKGNTPEPLGQDRYYDLIDPSYQYPDTAYAVTSWWDYGYWITRTAHRIPSDNPSQSPEPIRNVAHLFLSENQQDVQKYLDELKTGYVVIDNSMVIGQERVNIDTSTYTLLNTAKLWAVATWADITNTDYTHTFYGMKDNKVYPLRVFDPEYYKLFVVKLYNFDGKASTSEKPVVVTYETRTVGSNSYNILTEDPRQFDSYRGALTYIENNPDKKCYLCGTSPFVNPVPVEAVTDFTLVYGSTDNADSDNVPDVKIFQYTGKGFPGIIP
jgi:oligosaccharyl transferase (archaeosortase A-associated)